MILTHEINMDLTRRGDTPRVNAVQGDRNSRRIDVGLLSAGTAWEPPAEARVLLRYRRPDGTDGVYDTLPNGEQAAQISGSHICFTIAPDALSQPGAVRMAVSLMLEEQELTSFPILILVQPSYGTEVTEQGDYISIAGLLPAPETAEAGQYLAVDLVDEGGRVRSVKAVNAPAGSSSGECGVYYTPSVSQSDESTLELRFTPSSEEMPTPESWQITLPAGPQGEKGDPGEQGAQGEAGEPGQQGSDGKSAYAYAQEGGYTGTETEFAEKLAQDSAKTFHATLSAAEDGAYTLDKTFAQLLDAYLEGCLLYCDIPNEISGEGLLSLALYSYFNLDDFKSLVFESSVTATDGIWCHIVIVDADDSVYYDPINYTTPDALPCPRKLILKVGGKSASYDGSELVIYQVDAVKNPNALTINGTAYDGSEAVEITTPQALPNPHKLIFTGAVSGEYDGSAELILAIPAGGAQTETVLSDNLFDKSAAVSGQVFYPSSSGPSLTEDDTAFYAYVELRGAGVYRMKVSKSLHGDYAFRIPLVTADKTFIRNATATQVDSADTSNEPVVEFTVTADDITNGAAYICYDGAHQYLDSLMIVKDREYPTEYIPYGYIEVEPEDSGGDNVLYGKTAIFLGDSICAGTTTLADAAEYGYGWAGLIGEANAMTWANYGRNGGTVTPIESVDEARWLATQAYTALAEHAAADYIIFEGGCNDADTLGTDGLGTLSSSGYAPEADSDFTGAFETLVLKLLNSWPNARIGYIVAPKMGASGDYSSENNRYRQFFDRAVEICEKWGVPVLDLWKSNPLNPMLSAHYDSSLTADEANTAGRFYTDGQHLTLAGYNRITPQIEAFMRSL